MNTNLPKLREKTSKLTASPGVYIMKNKIGKIIYIGKAKNLRKRVSSYFRENPDHLPKVAAMVENVSDYDFIVTDSEYEALVLECSLIKQHKPKYNIMLKDDKGYFYIRISDEDYPRITAEKNTLKDGVHLGPYTSGFITKSSADEANRVFKLPTCQRKFPQDFRKGRACLNYHIKQCMGLCRGGISKEKYGETVNSAVAFIKNGSTQSLERMTEEMDEAAENLDFERAAVLRDRIAAIKKASQKQKIMNIGIENADVVGMATSSNMTCISVLMYRSGRLFDKVSFMFSDCDGADILETFMTQYYHGKTDIPPLIIIPHETENRELIEEMTRLQSGRKVSLQVPQKGSKYGLIQLAKNNSSEELALIQNKGHTGKEVIALEELGKVLGLTVPPQYIEAYDISNLSSSDMVAGMVVYEDGRPLKKAYKRFNIKSQTGQDDYGSMREVLRRRLVKIGNDKDEYFNRKPDLILLDGGKGHVNTVAPVLAELNLDIPLFGMVKNNKHRTKAIAAGNREIEVSSLKSAFSLLTQIQDEVHRYSVAFMHAKHKKNAYRSEFTAVKGIGEKKALKLMSHYKTKENLRKASVEELSKILSVNLSIAEELHGIINS